MRKLILLLLAALPLYTTAQNKATPAVDDFSDFSAKQWVFEGKHAPAEYLGKKCVKLVQNKQYAFGATLAYLDGYAFGDGSIEMDIATPFPKNKISFLGVLFRLNRVDNQPRYECFYFRPFMSGQSGAMQYMPINNGLVNWPDYTDAVYQAAPVCKTQQWFHVKVDVQGPMATVFVDGKMAYQVKNLARGSAKGSVGLWLGNTPEGYFANVKITRAAAKAGKPNM